MCKIERSQGDSGYWEDNPIIRGNIGRKIMSSLLEADGGFVSDMCISICKDVYFNYKAKGSI